MNPEELEALATRVAHHTAERMAPRPRRTAKEAAQWWAIVSTVVATVFGGILTGWEQIQSTLWGEELRADLKYVREHIDREGPEFVDAVDGLSSQLGDLLPAVEGLTEEVHKNEHADRSYRVGQFLRDCRQEERQAGRDSIPWTRDCAEEHADSLLALLEGS